VCTVLAFVFTSLAEKALADDRPPPSRMRPNATYRWTGNKPLPPPYARVEVVEDKGDYFGRVVDLRTGHVHWETMRESSPFVAKRKADAHHRKLEEMGRKVYPVLLAQWEEEQAGKARLTPTGRRLALVPPPPPPKAPRRPRKPRS